MNTHTALWDVYWYNTKPEHFRLKVSNLGHVRVQQREFVLPWVWRWATITYALRFGGVVEIANADLARQEIANLVSDKARERAHRKALRQQKWHIEEVDK